MAVLILNTGPGEAAFTAIGSAFTWLSDLSEKGSEFVFGERFYEHPFAFKVLPAIIFFSSLAAVLYYLGIMQWVVRGMAVVMQRLMGVSAESCPPVQRVCQTEAPYW
jgi:nucleoside permease NupC